MLAIICLAVGVSILFLISNLPAEDLPDRQAGSAEAGLPAQTNPPISPEEILKQLEELNKSDGFRRPYEAEGTSFVISNELFPHLTVESSEPIKLIAETVTNTVSFLVLPITTTHGNRTALTVSGLNSGFSGLDGKSLFRHENGFFIEEFTLNPEGKYSWSQKLDKDKAMHIYILPEKGTINIYGRDDPRDEVVSKGVGIWFDATTCQLTKEL